MSEETKMILKMVDEGKITPEQAVEMLKAVGKEDTCCNTTQKEWRGEEFVQEIEKWAKDFGQRMGSAVKDFEPKLKKMAQIMVQNTMKTADELGKVFKEQKEQEQQEYNEQEEFDIEDNEN